MRSQKVFASSALLVVGSAICASCIEGRLGGDGPVVIGEKPSSGNDEDSGVTPPEAVDPKGACSQSEVRRIRRPLVASRPEAGSFDYAFRLSPGTDPTSPVIVKIPGGPGSGSIDTERASSVYSPELTFLFTDPRGVGCNEIDGEVPNAELYSTVAFAEDILAALKDIGATSWAIYGTSYGTVLGTVTASLATSYGLPAPRAVVLEGVLAKPFLGQTESQGQKAEWDYVWNALPQASRALLLQDEPLGFDAAIWGTAINQLLSIGGTAATNSITIDLLTALADPALQAQVAPTVMQLGTTVALEPGPKKTLFENVACRELADVSFFDYSLAQGVYEPKTAVCEDIDLSHPYDVSAWPIRESPIFYFQGAHDPNTPLQQAKEHVSAQPETTRYFLEFAHGGHNPLQLSLPSSCVLGLWQTMLNAPGGLQAAIDACKLPNEITLTVTQP